MAKTVVGFFDSYDAARRAADELVKQGFDRNQLSLITNRQTYRGSDPVTETSDEPTGAAVGAATGAIVGGSAALVASMIPGVGPILAAGPLLAMLLGAGMGAVTGGLIGALVDVGVSEEDARLYEEGVRRGGTLLILHARDNASAQRAASIMNQNGAADIKKRGAEWKFAAQTRPSSTPGAGMATSSPQQPGEERRGRREGETRIPVRGATGSNVAEDEEVPIVAIVEEEVVVIAEEPGDPGSSRGRKDDSRRGQKGETADDADFREDFRNKYAGSGMSYQQCAPAYSYGSQLGSDQRNSAKDWNQVEQDARRDW
ncbi:MAG TPA: hypothetical protein VGP99_04525, partial [Tepidisphaeraceae bacterium]|nr:hypothetical protein [Tepidisphaeraceae bacterium]